MNKRNLQVFLEASEKIALEREQRLDEIFGAVEIDYETADRKIVSARAKAIGWPAALVAISAITAPAAVAIAAMYFIPPTILIFTAALPVAWAFYKFRKISQFIKKSLPSLAGFIEKNRINPDEQMEAYVSKLQDKLSEKTDMTEEQIEAFIELVVARVSEDEKCKEIAEKMTAALKSKENNELQLFRLTRQYDSAVQKVYEKLAEEAKEIYAASPDEQEPEQEPEEELAMVAESKQYNRWKVIAGVKK